MRARVAIAVVALGACASDPVESDGSSSTDGGTSSTTSSTTTSSTTGMTLEPSTSSSAESSTGADSTAAGTESSSSGGTGSACEFAAEVAAVVADARSPIDCGALTDVDPVEAWEDARSCARDAQLSQQPFSLAWQIDDGGTLRDVAFASAGFSMPLHYLTDDAAVGTASIEVVTCTGTATPPGKCVVEVGEMCLACLDPTIAVELCE